MQQLSGARTGDFGKRQPSCQTTHQTAADRQYSAVPGAQPRPRQQYRQRTKKWNYHTDQSVIHESLWSPVRWSLVALLLPLASGMLRVWKNCRLAVTRRRAKAVALIATTSPVTTSACSTGSAGSVRRASATMARKVPELIKFTAIRRRSGSVSVNRPCNPNRNTTIDRVM